MHAIDLPMGQATGQVPTITAKASTTTAMNTTITPYVGHDSTPSAAAIARHIETLSRSIFDKINARDYDAPVFQHISIHCQFTQDHISVSSRQDTFEIHRQYIKMFPLAWYEIQNMSVSVDELNDRAVVWMSLNITGETRTRESVRREQWERRKGTWFLTRISGLEGLSDYFS